ncbi:MAG TPA: hypothetical protein VJY39_15765 [Acidisphaera sp.]|nr:hypothetical protein [Acidisphaera sp.]
MCAGTWANDEHWWTLVFDTDTKRLFIMHEWDLVDADDISKSDKGWSEIEVADFLANGPDPARDQLAEIIRGLFQTNAARATDWGAFTKVP